MTTVAVRRTGVRRTLLTALTIGSVVIVAGPVLPAGAAPEAKVTICHRTNATNNPYVRITVAQSAVDGVGGKGDHFVEHTGPIWTFGQPNGGQWGDIIPPIPGIHDGLNWSIEGRAIWRARCEPGLATRDSDGDGIRDITEDRVDSDGDDQPDVTDVDDDGDGIPDLTDPTSDTDGDGTPDVTDADDDGDGTPDVTDTDDDGDGIPDVTDPDEDPDGDGKPNASDPDNDNDGARDTVDPDLDNDGVPSSEDSDDDGDGISDANDPDRTNSGIPDERDNPDSDSDGQRDVTDRDDDNDGTSDTRDRDRNGDGLIETTSQQPETDLKDIVEVGRSRVVIPSGSRFTVDGMRIHTSARCIPSVRSRAGLPAGDLESSDLCRVRSTSRGLVISVRLSVPVTVVLQEQAAEVADLLPLLTTTRVRLSA